MPHGIFQTISGVKGEVTIPQLGAVIGTIIQWRLTRRGDDDSPELGLYDLRAVFSYLNVYLWADDDYPKEVVVILGRTKQLRVVASEETVLAGKTLLMKGVTLNGDA